MSAVQAFHNLKRCWHLRKPLGQDFEACKSCERAAERRARCLPYLTEGSCCAQDNELTGDLSAYAADLSGLELPSATRFFSVGGNRLTGAVSEEFQKLGAFLQGDWNILDGLLFQKTLNLSHNAFSGQLPTWALHSMSADKGLTVQLAVRPAFSTNPLHLTHASRILQYQSWTAMTERPL